MIKGIPGKASNSFLMRDLIGNVDLIITYDVIANKIGAEMTGVIL